MYEVRKDHEAVVGWWYVGAQRAMSGISIDYTVVEETIRSLAADEMRDRNRRWRYDPNPDVRIYSELRKAARYLVKLRDDAKLFELTTARLSFTIELPHETATNITPL